MIVMYAIYHKLPLYNVHYNYIPYTTTIQRTLQLHTIHYHYTTYTTTKFVLHVHYNYISYTTILIMYTTTI